MIYKLYKVTGEVVSLLTEKVLSEEEIDKLLDGTPQVYWRGKPDEADHRVYLANKDAERLGIPVNPFFQNKPFYGNVLEGRIVKGVFSGLLEHTCPLCGGVYTDYPALSRVDSETEICSGCGVREALIPQNAESFKELWKNSPLFDELDWSRLEDRDRRRMN